MITPRSHRASALCALALALAGARCAPLDDDDASVGLPLRAVEVTEAGATEAIALDLATLALIDDGPFVALEGDAVVPCGDGGVIHEGGRVEVRTRWCDPADLATTLTSSLSAGTVVDFQLSHDPLLADGGAVHLAIVVGDEIVWQLERSLPMAAAFFHERVPLALPHAAGERVVVHIHNHGANSYAIHDLRFDPQ